MRHGVLVSFLLFTALDCALAPAPAAGAGVELTPFVGYSSNPDYAFSQGLACLAIFTDCTVRGETDDGSAYGLILGVALRPGWQLELLANRQEFDLQARGRFVSVSPGFPDVFFTDVLDYDVTHLQLGASRSFGEGTVRPFLGAAVGGSRVEIARDDRLITGSSKDALSASVGGGVKVDVSPRLAVRVEGRGWWVDLDGESGGDYTQLDAAAGLAFHW
jgi:opacity protein-like surface antigen